MRLPPLWLLIALFIPAQQSPAQSPSRPFTLEITPNRQPGKSFLWDFKQASAIVVRAGAIVEVAVRKRNISDHEIPKILTTSEPFTWIVRNARGDTIPPRTAVSRDGWIRSGGPSFRRGTKDLYLEPSESFLIVGRMSGYDMSLPGTYTVQVAQHVSERQNSPVIQSNIVTVTVLPAAQPHP
jgi:hypothetical protein